MPYYAWCFSHGTMHYSDWCAANTVQLRANHDEDAHRLKEYLFGDAQFLYELPQNLQYIVSNYRLKL